MPHAGLRSPARAEIEQGQSPQARPAARQSLCGERDAPGHPFIGHAAFARARALATEFEFGVGIGPGRGGFAVGSYSLDFSTIKGNFRIIRESFGDEHWDADLVQRRFVLRGLLLSDTRANYYG